jgi:hypothetical protein
MEKKLPAKRGLHEAAGTLEWDLEGLVTVKIREVAALALSAEQSTAYQPSRLCNRLRFLQRRGVSSTECRDFVCF